MAQTVIKTLKIDELSKFGFKSDGRYINWSKNAKDADKVGVVPGVVIEAELYIADSGKEYVNKVLKGVATPKAETPKAEFPKAAKAAPVAKKAEEMTRADWDAKDRRISRQGCIQAAVQALSAYSSDADDLFSRAAELAEKMLGFVNS